MYKVVFYYLFGMVFSAGYSMQIFAAGELHLKFHIGGAVGNESFIGGTLVNTGDAPVAHGYVVVTLLDGQCHPLKSVLQSFYGITAGEQKDFRIPISGGLKRYRLSSIKGFDDAGFELISVDDNAHILQDRESWEREDCAKTRDAPVHSTLQ